MLLIIFFLNRITIITGYLPQEVLGTNMYDYIHSEDLKEFAESHCFMLQHGNNLLVSTVICNVSSFFSIKLKSR